MIAHRFRQITGIILVALVSVLTACLDSDPPLGVIGHVEGDFGGVVSDEPTAALIAGDVLSAGGTAADAAVALYFAMSVTFPSAAGLGGGGVCIVHDGETAQAEALDFTSGRPARRLSNRYQEFAVPSNVRGMAALHVRYGRLNWSQVVQPAERLARFGHPVSHALAHEFLRYEAIVNASGGLGAMFKDDQGSILKGGEELRQLELAVILGQVRARGAGDFYTGVLARRLAASYQAAGGSVTVDDLRNYRPVWRKTTKGSFGNHDVHFAPSSVLGGALAASLWDTLKEKGAYQAKPAKASNMVVVEATAKAYSALVDRPDGAVPDYSVTSFVTMDRLGGAVACSVTMNSPFGVGRFAPGTGIIPGVAPTPERDGRISLAPMLIVNKPTADAFLAAGASGDASSPTSVISVVLKLLLDGKLLSDAVDAPRYHAGRTSRTVFAEARANAVSTAQFKAAGYRVIQVPDLGRVNAIWCAKGIQEASGECVYVADKRGFGYGVSVER